MIVPTSFSLDTCNLHRFTILRPFYHDSRFTTETTNSSYKTLVNNLLTKIPLPDRNKLLLFKSYAYPVLHSVLDDHDENELDVNEH